MPEVTCPACRTRQAVDATAAGYTCTSCGADWDFVACSRCGERFHARPDATSWRCPTCGTENARAHAGDAAPLGLPLGPNRTMVLGVVGVILIALVTWGLTRGGGEDGTAASPAADASPTVGAALQALCAHLVDIQSLRFDALGRVASTLRQDAEAIEAEGDAELARDVRRLARRVAALRDALDTPESEDDQDATEALLVALEPIPCRAPAP